MAAALAANEVISFYSYTPINDPEAHAAWQRETAAALALHGRVIVATEGVSGTASGAAAATREYVSKLEAALGPACVVASMASRARAVAATPSLRRPVDGSPSSKKGHSHRRLLRRLVDRLHGHIFFIIKRPI